MSNDVVSAVVISNDYSKYEPGIQCVILHSHVQDKRIPFISFHSIRQDVVWLENAPGNARPYVSIRDPFARLLLGLSQRSIDEHIAAPQLCAAARSSTSKSHELLPPGGGTLRCV